jgi:hypothetical protein
MSNVTRNLWPYSRRAAVITAPGILLALIILIAITRQLLGWPTDEAERFVLLGIFILSLVPLFLDFADMLAEKRAVLEYKGLKLDFARMSESKPSAVSIPTNIGVPGLPVPDNDSAEIIPTLRKAVGSEVVVLDLEDGQAWWETRLLVLLSGAARLGHPRAIVFTATEGGKLGVFQGWGYPKELLPALLGADPRYRKSYYVSRAIANQWALAEPATELGFAPQHISLTSLALQYQGMAFDPSSNLPNEFAAEQFLASELSWLIEIVEQPRMLSIVRLRDLFAPMLNTKSINQRSSPEQHSKNLSRVILNTLL